MINFSFSNVFFSILSGIGAYIVYAGIAGRRKKGGAARLEAGLPSPVWSWTGGGSGEPNLVISDMPLPLVQRALAQPLADVGARLSRVERGDIEDRLRRSGWRYTSLGDYYASKVLGAVVLFVVAVIPCILFKLPLLGTVVVAAGSGLLGLFNPDLEIHRAIERRRKALFREMAWTLDRLAIVLESGMGFDTAITDLIWVSKGRGGLFMALLRDLGNTLLTGETNVTDIVEKLERSVPHLAEVDEFFQLVRTNLEKAQPIAGPLKILGDYMRDELNNNIEERRQKAEMTVVAITAGPVILGLLIAAVGPAMLGFFRVF